MESVQCHLLICWRVGTFVPRLINHVLNYVLTVWKQVAKFLIQCGPMWRVQTTEQAGESIMTKYYRTDMVKIIIYYSPYS